MGTSPVAFSQHALLPRGNIRPIWIAGIVKLADSRAMAVDCHCIRSLAPGL
jgi:hypothetical protein